MIPMRGVNTNQQSRSMTVPAPMGGLNGRDSLAEMPPTDAYYLDNWLPGTTNVKGRRGAEDFVTGLGSPVMSVETYAGQTGHELLAFAGGKVLNVTTGISSELATGKNDDTVITAMFSNAAETSFMVCVTGSDIPYRYDGVDIIDLTMTGITGPSSLNYTFAFKGRLYFAATGLLGFYYLPLGQIQGALSYFDLGQQARRGGHLVAIASISMDAGDGPDDYILFITSRGEVIMYAGFDPSNAASWEIVGRYYTAEPVGRRCVCEFAGDLLILTVAGAVPFSEIRRVGEDRGNRNTAITDKLGELLLRYSEYADYSGWQALTYPAQGWIILNVPASQSVTGKFYQFVMNTKTGAWTRFTNWNALTFTVFEKKLYFGTSDGRVVLADTGFQDFGQDIKLDGKQAYNNFEDGTGAGNQKKHFQWCILNVACVGGPPLSARFNVDYTESTPQYVGSLDDSGVGEWDVSFWDTVDWAGGETTQRFHNTLNTYGIVGSLWLRATTRVGELKWFSTEVVYEKARGLVP